MRNASDARRRWLRRTLGGVLFSALSLGTAAAETPEAVAFSSLDGKRTLPGYWFRIEATAPRPAVILLHGCDGTLDEHGRLYRKRFRVAEFFNVEKMHVLVLDSFTPRGIKSICTIPYGKRIIEYEDRRDDVFAAMRWLSRHPLVDQGRIGLLGYSHGAGVVLSAFARTDRAVQAQPVPPKAGVAFYPRCEPFAQMWSYDVVAPLLVMIGELDDVLPADQCVRLHGKVKRTRPDAPFDLIVFPGSHHGFDGTGPARVMPGYSARAGKGTVGGNPDARAESHQRMFDFLSAQLGTPLALTHAERLYGHRHPSPPASGFARGDDVSAVPLDEKGRERYRHYLGLAAPKAFAISAKGRPYYASDDAFATSRVADICRNAKVACWLYAVDDRVVWSADPAARIDPGSVR
jgi:dienelactone hydrolase